MESATITKVTLRQEKLRSGKLSLYLDYYPPIWNPHIKKMSRREFLGLYLIGSPKDKFELDYNEEIMLKARGIRATRELAIINEEFGFLDRTKKQADFLEYFESKTKEKYQKWEIVYKHFKNFCNGRCLMKDVTIGLCNDFRTYILKIRVKQSGNIISRNSAAGYWSTFRALLKLAYKEGWLRENVNDYLDRIDWEEPKINYLEIEEVKRLAATPCKVDVLKRVAEDFVSRCLMIFSRSGNAPPQINRMFFVLTVVMGTMAFLLVAPTGTSTSAPSRSFNMPCCTDSPLTSL